LYETLKAYLLVVKPRMVAANLLAAAGGFFLAAQGHASIALFASVMAGLCLIVASACVCNNCIDRRLDRDMARTSGRPLATGAVSLAGCLVYAGILGAAGAAVLAAGTNARALAVALGGFAVYVGVYSLVLKRRSMYSTAIGSLAGAAPPLAAYLAVRGRFDSGAFIVLAMFSLWQIPHSYAIAIFRLEDYAAARVPVMPVKAGVPATKRHIIWHIVAFTLAAQMLTAFGYAGYAYLASATVLGLCWLYLALSGGREGDDRPWARRVYLFSILTIFVLSVAMSVDFAAPPA
jgi:protoheme IX farnesyltransferase